MSEFSDNNFAESYFPADTSRQLMDVTLGDILRKAAHARPTHLALIDGQADPALRRRWTYEQLLKDAENTAQHLLEHFEPGDRVAVWASNKPEWIIILFGCAMAGLILVTVNPAYKRKELEYVLRKAKVAGLFVMDEYRGYPMYKEAAALKNAIQHLSHIFRLEDFTPFVAVPADPKPLPKVQTTDPCVIMFTSGTTGVQKGVMFHHRGVINVTYFAQERAGLDSDGVFVNPMPMFHIGSLGNAGIACVTHMATHIVAPHWDPELYLTLVEAEGGTYSLLVPTMIEGVLGFPDLDNYSISTLKDFASGAAAVDPSLIVRTRERLGASICNYYGSTETQGPICGVSKTDPDHERTYTIGRPMPHIEMKIGDPNTGEVLPVGELGEIYTRGYQTMLGYFDMPEETAKTIDADGWMHSGDIGAMDSRGYFTIKGRIKDVIIRGGENIYPREIETLLNEHPEVSEAVLVGVPDSYWGEVVAAVIIPRSFEAPPASQILASYCQENLAAYKVPRQWYIAHEYPMTETGKVQKFKLIEAIENGQLETLTS